MAMDRLPAGTQGCIFALVTLATIGAGAIAWCIWMLLHHLHVAVR